MPPYPTKHLPGTPGKIAVMAWRIEMGYHLHHPDDATLYDHPLFRRQITHNEDGIPVHPNDPLPDTRGLLEQLATTNWCNSE